MLHRSAVEGSRSGKPPLNAFQGQSVHPAAYPAPMPLVQPCSKPGCSTLTMGDLCLEHDQLAQERLAQRLVALSRATAGALKRFEVDRLSTSASALSAQHCYQHRQESQCSRSAAVFARHASVRSWSCPGSSTTRGSGRSSCRRSKTSSSTASL